MTDDRKTLLLACAIALAAGGEKNVKTILSKAKALAKEIGEELDGEDDSNDDNTETDDDSDSEDADSGSEDENEDSDSDESEENEDSGNDEDEEDGEDSEDEPASKKRGKKQKLSTAGKKAGKAAPAKGKKNFKKKPQTYARDNDTHKEIFSGVLKAVAPAWKKSATTKKLAKDASVKLEGEDFLDAEGEVLASFKQSVKKHMKVK